MILEVCRACMRSDKPLIDLFDSVSEHGITLAEMYNTTAEQPAVRDDQWPQSICITCLMFMIDAFELQMLIEANMEYYG